MSQNKRLKVPQQTGPILKVKHVQCCWHLIKSHAAMATSEMLSPPALVLTATSIVRYLGGLSPLNICCYWLQSNIPLLWLTIVTMMVQDWVSCSISCGTLLGNVLPFTLTHLSWLKLSHWRQAIVILSSCSLLSSERTNLHRCLLKGNSPTRGNVAKFNPVRKRKNCDVTLLSHWMKQRQLVSQLGHADLSHHCLQELHHPKGHWVYEEAQRTYVLKDAITFGSYFEAGHSHPG